MRIVRIELHRTSASLSQENTLMVQYKSHFRCLSDTISVPNVGQSCFVLFFRNVLILSYSCFPHVL